MTTTHPETSIVKEFIKRFTYEGIFTHKGKEVKLRLFRNNPSTIVVEAIEFLNQEIQLAVNKAVFKERERIVKIYELIGKTAGVIKNEKMRDKIL